MAGVTGASLAQYLDALFQPQALDPTITPAGSWPVPDIAAGQPLTLSECQDWVPRFLQTALSELLGPRLQLLLPWGPRLPSELEIFFPSCLYDALVADIQHDIYSTMPGATFSPGMFAFLAQDILYEHIDAAVLRENHNARDVAFLFVPSDSAGDVGRDEYGC